MHNERQPESDSDEDDQDYVPAAGDRDDSGLEDEPAQKKQRLDVDETLEDNEAAAKKRAELWSTFQASVSTPGSSTSSVDTRKKMVKIEKKYRFAGEEVIEIQEVPEDSEDAKKWPRLSESTQPEDADDTKLTASSPANAEEASISTPPACSSATTLSTTRPGVRRPGPRKPKTTLAPLPAKAKKLTTLEKSAMDWQAHLASQPSSEVQSELEANRRGGGYLERVGFLERVGDRKDSLLGAAQGAKRRR